MLRIRPLIAAASFLLALVFATGTVCAQTPVDFGTPQLGEVRTGCFTVCFGTSGNCNGSGTISSLAVDAPYFVRGVRVGPDSSPHLCDNTPDVTTPANLPAGIGPGERLVFDVDLVPTDLGSAQSPLRINGSDAFDLFATIPGTTGCAPGPGVNCLSDDRFRTRVHWRTSFGTRGSAGVVPVPSDDSGLFYFFNPNNWEMLIKVLNTCDFSDRFWVFAAATTNVEYTITVVDTQASKVKTYFNPQGNPAEPVQDTQAFATCP